MAEKVIAFEKHPSFLILIFLIVPIRGMKISFPLSVFICGCRVFPDLVPMATGMS
jgi:hypothetical protein